MKPTILEWDHLPCPDCHAPELGECIYESEEVARGCAVVCSSCGFSIAGRSREMVLASVRVLARWKRV